MFQYTPTVRHGDAVGNDARALDRLMEKSGLYLYAQPVPADAGEDEVWVQLMNQTEKKLAEIQLKNSSRQARR